MAERTLAVRLVAMVDQYRAAMAGAAKSTDMVTQAAGHLQNMGSSISRVGDTLSTRVTLPLVALGGVATKMASDFDSSFVQMQTLAGVSAKEVDGLKDSVLKLSGETGKAPKELADAMYFLSSSGLTGAAAMDALEMSAKASAAGLGQTEVVADAVSSAMLAYAQSGLTAAEATDVLIATAKAGKAEPAELADQMGRLVPLSSELGISFADVGASIAALSTKGNDAAAATTQLSNVMAKLLSPSQQASELLDEVGLSAGELRGMIAEKGLLGTLEALQESLGKTNFIKFFEDIQAKEGVLALLGGDLEKTRGIFEDVNDSVGETEQAFATWAKSMGAQNTKAFADLQVAMIRFGEVLAPIVADVLGFIGDLAEGFASLPDWAQKATVGMLALVAAMGPLMSVGGRVMQIVGGIIGLADTFANSLVNASASAMNLGTSSATLSSGLSMTAVSLGVIAPLAIAAGIALHSYMQTKAEAKKATNELTEALKKEAEGLRGVVDESLNAQIAEGGLGKELRKAKADLDLFNTAIKESKDEIDSFDELTAEGIAPQIDKLAESGSKLGLELQRLNEEMGLGKTIDLIERLNTLAGSYDSATEATKNQEFAQQSVAEEYGQTTESIEDATEALNKHLDALRAQFDPLFGMVDAIRANRDAQLQLTEAEAAMNQARVDHGAGSLEAAEAERNYADALDGSLRASTDMQFAAAELKGAMLTQGLSLEDATAKLVNWAMQAGYTEAQAYEMAAGLGFATTEAHRLDGIDPSVVLSLQDGATPGLNDLHAQLQALTGRTFLVNVGIVGTGIGVVGKGGAKVFHQGGIVAGPRGQEVAAILQAGERVLPLDDPINHLLDTYTSSPTSAITGPVSVGAGWGAPPVVVTFDLSGMDRRLKDWIAHTVRVDGGGSVQVAFS